MTHKEAQVMSLHEVAEFLGKSWQFVNEHVKNGDIPAFKIGSAWFISRQYLQDLITIEKGE
jgi:excisionase family DNA binding protein